MNPFEKWYGYKPFFVHLKVFGSHAWAHITKETCNNLETRSQHCSLVGYNETSKEYHLYDPSTNKLIERRDVFERVLSHGSLGYHPIFIVEYSPPNILVDLCLLRPHDPLLFSAFLQTSSTITQSNP
jgi:hypothetical protein